MEEPRVRRGKTRFVRDKGRERGDVGRLRFVLIDEFWDFSRMFSELIGAIRFVNGDARVFCVGDDWQAINGFAGSDLRFFDDFESHFRDTSRRHIRTNYRSSRSVVEAGNALMHGRGLLARAKHPDPGSVLLCKLDQFEPAPSERKTHGADRSTPALLRVVRSFLDRGMEVAMLSRDNYAPWPASRDGSARRAKNTLDRFLDHVRLHLPEQDRGLVTASTVHGFKGAECSVVVVLDALQRKYPLIYPHWAFLRVFGDSIDRVEDEERRLFYVAVTGAKNSLALLTETPSQSPYLGDIHRRLGLTELSWTDLAPVPSLNGARLEIRVFTNAFDVRDRLRYLKYKFHAAGQYWFRPVMAEGFSFDTLLKQPWTEGVRVEVHAETGELLYWR